MPGKRKLVGSFIRMRRHALGMSAADLAELAGLSEQTVLRTERGETAPSLETLEQIAAALGDTLPNLLSGSWARR